MLKAEYTNVFWLNFFFLNYTNQYTYNLKNGKKLFIKSLSLYSILKQFILVMNSCISSLWNISMYVLFYFFNSNLTYTEQLLCVR